jgi:hypothetical protein
MPRPPSLNKGIRHGKGPAQKQQRTPQAQEADATQAKRIQAFNQRSTEIASLTTPPSHYHHLRKAALQRIVS